MRLAVSLPLGADNMKTDSRPLLISKGKKKALHSEILSLNAPYRKSKKNDRGFNRESQKEKN